MKYISINADRLWQELGQLATYSEAPAPAVTRVMLSSTDLAARGFVIGLCEDEGLQIREDPAGNIFARWIGGEPGSPAVGTGSHTDAIPHSGRFDGTVGVLGAIEAIRALKQSGFQPRRSIELLMFTSEEPTRYGIGCLGSRLLSGTMSPDHAARLIDNDEITFEQKRKDIGCTGELADVKLSNDYYSAFVELHIEQGPLLERESTPIGIVTAIAAPAAIRIEFKGMGGHAGAVLMPDRADALLSASELALGIEQAALTIGGQDTVATTGVLDVHPRAINSIPSRTVMEIDVRDIELDRRDKVLEEIKRQASEIARARNQNVVIEQINADPPATCDDSVIAAIETSCNETNTTYKRMISRAYHDSLFMATIAPTGMIFIPCRDGVSHRPDEYASPEEISTGVEILARTLAKLSHAT